MTGASLQPLLDFQHLTVLQGGENGIHDLTLRINQGEHVALIGPNGSGKSTLIKTITRDLYPRLNDATVCRLFGEDVWDVAQLKSRFGIVSNDLQQWCAREITATETILSGFFSSIGLWPNLEVTPAMRAKAASILELLEVPHLADRPMTELSSGEARRLLIGRALVHDPTALLLDEPTNSRDFRAAHEFREIVSKLARRGTTILMVTHIVADVIPEISRVVLLKSGRLFRDGPKKEILTAPVLSALFDMPIHVDVTADRYSIR